MLRTDSVLLAELINLPWYTYQHANVYMYIYIYIYIMEARTENRKVWSKIEQVYEHSWLDVQGFVQFRCLLFKYGKATLGRLPQLPGLFWKRVQFLKKSFAQETWKFRENANLYHPHTERRRNLHNKYYSNTYFI